MSFLEVTKLATNILTSALHVCGSEMATEW